MNQFCVLVASSDDRKDIFDVCFAHSERIWKDCNWPRYVGFNSPYADQYGFQTVTAAPAGNWSEQVRQYVDMLPAEIKYILLMVEDALFMKPVDFVALEDIAWLTFNWRLSYVRLVPVRRNLFSRLSQLPSTISNTVDVIHRNEPYYSSTEMAIWERGYLCEQLERMEDAWSFEHLVSKHQHWAVTHPLFKQHQIVQKGRWNWNAPKWLKRVGLPPPPPGRPYQTTGARLRGYRENLSFALFGFTSFRIKRWLYTP